MNYEKLKANLENNGFAVSRFATAKEAAEYLNKKIDGKTVAAGGSVTLREMGVMEMLNEHNTVFWHWFQSTPEEAMSTDVYLTSANGLAETGEIVNIDGAGNRVASAIYGHKEIYYVVGANKIAPDFDAALWRARNIAGPKNAQRLNRKTPCAVKADKCYNCNSPERICNALSVIWKKPSSFQYAEVILIDEEIGF